VRVNSYCREESGRGISYSSWNIENDLFLGERGKKGREKGEEGKRKRRKGKRRKRGKRI